MSIGAVIGGGIGCMLGALTGIPGMSIIGGMLGRRIGRALDTGATVSHYHSEHHHDQTGNNSDQHCHHHSDDGSWAHHDWGC